MTDMADGGLTETETDAAVECALRMSYRIFEDLEDAADEDLNTAALGVLVNLIWYLNGMGWTGDELVKIVQKHSK